MVVKSEGFANTETMHHRLTDTVRETPGFIPASTGDTPGAPIIFGSSGGSARRRGCAAKYRFLFSVCRCLPSFDPRDWQVSVLAEVDGRVIHGQLLCGGPQFDLIPAGMTAKTPVTMESDIHGK